MGMICTRCEGTGFLNLEQVDEDTLHQFEATGDHQIILDWIADRQRRMDRSGGCSCCICPPCHYCTELMHDVSVCDCCGDGEDWYGTPGEHKPGEPSECD